MSRIVNTIVENLTGMDIISDQNIASDLLNEINTAIKSYAQALTEATTPGIRTVLRSQLNETINFHDKVTAYMMEKGWYLPYDIQAQIELDLKGAEKALSLRD